MSERTGSQVFDVETFVDGQVSEIRRVIGSGKALIACSGGVDSTVAAVLTHRAIGENLICIFIDDNFMRLDEPPTIAKILSSPTLNLPVRVVNVRKRFMKALEGLVDAEEKRKAFRETFYNVLGEVAKKEKCRFLVQGTIAPDVLETKGGVKSQHNVLAQIGINPVEKFGFQVVEPVLSLYKPQVREVARYLGIPPAISERQPFCGPGLSVRTVGKIKSDKLEAVRNATAIVEKELTGRMIQQYFAAIIDSETMEDPDAPKLRVLTSKILKLLLAQVNVQVLKSKATGVKERKRLYGKIALISTKTEAGNIHKPQIQNLIQLSSKLVEATPTFVRVLYNLTEKPRNKPYIIAIRAITTQDFVTAKAAQIDLVTLIEIERKIMECCPNISAVYYDLTNKPVATIEFE